MMSIMEKLRLFLVVVIAAAFLLGGGITLMALDDKPVAVSQQDIDLAATLKAREEALDEREKQLISREQEYAGIKKDVDEKLIRLTAMQAEIETKINAMSGVQDKQFKNLIKIYSTMSTAKVALLLNTMDDPSVIKILRAMKSDAVAQILPKLDVAKAVLMSKQLGLIQ
ncbi:MAG: hypothetical protein A2511_12050 [Deltaproteobacteria bacterium RIFOXYD12_FULL_50_9]|nr:MAG: hypothetical protein A2511_12050 [Deltaproteobacteria bacterium RIFOXYD12_FULL_50_9]